MDNNKLIRKEYCFLSPEGEKALKDIQACGIEDKDLALTILEKIAKDEDIYELEER